VQGIDQAKDGLMLLIMLADIGTELLLGPDHE
jgi:hypothetical protein